MQCSRDIVSFFPLLFTMCLLLSRYSWKYFLRSIAHTKSELISRFNSMNQHMGQIFEIYHNNGITTWQLTTSSGLLKTLCQPTSSKLYWIISFFILKKLVLVASNKKLSVSQLIWKSDILLSSLLFIWYIFTFWAKIYLVHCIKPNAWIKQGVCHHVHKFI